MTTTGNAMIGYDWLRDGLVPGLSAFLETLWLFAWVTFGPRFLEVMPGFRGSELHSPGWGFVWIWLLIAGPALAGRWLEFRYPRQFSRRQWLLTAVVVVLFAAFVKTQGIPGRSLLDWRWLVDVVFPWAGVEPGVGLGLLGFTWLGGIVLAARGVWLANGEADEDSGTRWFLLGLGAFLLLVGIMLAWTWGADVELELGALLGVYFCVGLIWLGLIKQQEIEERAFGRTLRRLRMSWLGLFAGISAVTFGIGVAVAAAQGLILGGATTVAEGSAPAVSNIWQAIGVVERHITHAYGLVLLFFLRLLPQGWLRSLLDQQAADTTTSDPQPPQIGGPQLPLPPHIQEVALSLLLLFILMLLIQRVRHIRVVPDGGDEQTSVWSWELVKSQLRELVPRRRRRSAVRQAPIRRAADAGDALPAMRALYLAVLRWARDRQHPREPAATPHEFSSELGRLLPEELASQITAAYVEARYGPETPLEADARALRKQWDSARK